MLIVQVNDIAIWSRFDRSQSHNLKYKYFSEKSSFSKLQITFFVISVIQNFKHFAMQFYFSSKPSRPTIQLLRPS